MATEAMVEWLKANSGAVIEAALGSVEDGERAELNTSLVKIYNTVDEALADGFQIWNDVAKIIGTAIPELMSLADSFGKLDGDSKREFVVENVVALYRLADSGKDGSLNRINIPILFGSLETKVENIVVRKLAELAIEAVYSRNYLTVVAAPSTESDIDLGVVDAESVVDEETVYNESGPELDI